MNDQSSEFEGVKIEIPKPPYPEILPVTILNDESFLIYLPEFAVLCGGAHVFGQITMTNYMQLAVNIVSKVGALKHYDG